MFKVDLFACRSRMKQLWIVTPRINKKFSGEKNALPKMLWVLSNEIPLPQLPLLPITTRVYYSVLLEQYIFLFLSLSLLSFLVNVSW